LLLLLLLLFTYLYFSGKTLAAQEFQKSAIKLVWKCIQLWPIIINKTIVQQNIIKSLHHDGNPLKQKRRCANIPGRFHQSLAQLAQELNRIPVD